MFVVGTLLLYVALTGVLGWWLRDQLVQAELPDWVQTRLQSGWFSSGVELSSSVGAPLDVRLHGRLQHGPLLRQPWQAGLLRLDGNLELAGQPQSLPDHGELDATIGNSTPDYRNLGVTLKTGFSGFTSIDMALPQRLDLRQQPALFNGPVTGTVTIKQDDSRGRGVLQHGRGILCLPNINTIWQELDWRMQLDNTANWLQSGGLILDAAVLSIHQGDPLCTLIDTSREVGKTATIGALRMQLDWPRETAIVLRMDAASWHAAANIIGPLHLRLELQQLDRAVLGAWLQAALDTRTSATGKASTTMQQLTLAAQTAELLRTRPLLRLHQLLISSASGDFSLSGEIQLRPGGMRANLQGETNAKAAEQMLTVVMGDSAAASSMLQQWQRLGLVQDIDGRWLIDIVVNQ